MNNFIKYNAKIDTNTIPLFLFIFLSCSAILYNHTKQVAPINKNIVGLKLYSNSICFIIAPMPKINNIFIIHEPIIFPIANSSLFFIIANIDVINSGKEVPNAIKLKPITL